MIDFRKPYTPVAGKMPKYLSGRENVVDAAHQYIKATASGYPARSVVYYGLRGVGKTVLLNKIEELCENENILNCHIEVKDQSNFIKAISVACNGFIQNLSLKEDVTFSLELLDLVGGMGNAGTGDLANDLTELLVTLGRYARSTSDAICFCIDEIQYAKTNELEAFITAVHRANQLDLPILFFCAGLPKILKMMGEIKPYSERLFEFIKIGLPSCSAAEHGITVSAEN